MFWNHQRTPEWSQAVENDNSHAERFIEQIVETLELCRDKIAIFLNNELVHVQGFSICGLV